MPKRVPHCDIYGRVAKLKGGDAAQLAAAAKRQGEGAALADQLKKRAADVAQLCIPADSGLVAKAEKDMYDTVRAFAASPLADKAARKASFDAARAKVLEFKVQVDQALADANSLVDKLIAVGKT